MRHSLREGGFRGEGNFNLLRHHILKRSFLISFVIIPLPRGIGISSSFYPFDTSVLILPLIAYIRNNVNLKVGNRRMHKIIRSKRLCFAPQRNNYNQSWVTAITKSKTQATFTYIWIELPNLHYPGASTDSICNRTSSKWSCLTLQSSNFCETDLKMVRQCRLLLLFLQTKTVF